MASARPPSQGGRWRPAPPSSPATQPGEAALWLRQGSVRSPRAGLPRQEGRWAGWAWDGRPSPCLGSLAYHLVQSWPGSLRPAPEETWVQIWSEMRVLETRRLRTGLVWRWACGSAWWALSALHPRGLGPLGRHLPCWALVNEGDPGPGLGSLQPTRLPRGFTPCTYSTCCCLLCARHQVGSGRTGTLHRELPQPRRRRR